MEKKFGTQSRISNQMLKLHKGIIQPCLSHPILANILVNDGNINLLMVGLSHFKFEFLKTTLSLENILVRSCQSILVLAPSADPALLVGEVLIIFVCKKQVCEGRL